MKCTIKGTDFYKLLQYQDSVCISIEGSKLKACAKLKGLETLVGFPIVINEGADESFAVTFPKTVNYFRECPGDITMSTSKELMTLSDGYVTMDMPITRDIIADFTIPETDPESLTIMRKTAALRSMLGTMNEVSKALMDYVGTYLTIHNGVASIMNCSMLLECEVDLPDMVTSVSSISNMLSITNSAEEVYVTDTEQYVLFVTTDIVIRVVKEAFNLPVSAESLMKKYAVLDVTDVKAPGTAKMLKALSYFKDSHSASITYNENEFGISMRGNSYNVYTDIKGHTIFINPRVLTVLGRFLNADHYTITRGEKHVCLSSMSRKLVICATSF